MSEKLQSIRGMKDLLPDDLRSWQAVETQIREVARLYGYDEIRLPVLERTELFKRSIGDATDIVEKEMYTFADNSGESITLRPEATASCARAGIQHGMFYNKQCRLWYMGPMFRYERPQKGRYRQFHQFGIEAFGWPGPDIDAEIILFGKTLWERLQIQDSTILEINTLGTPECRARFRAELVAYFEKYHDDLDDDSKRRLHLNPLRILDSKNPKMQELIESAPTLRSFLSAGSQRHFEQLIEALEAAQVSYRLNARLVRGLDYYTGAVFEWVTDLLGAQNAICAGGRYDGLVRSLGGADVPGAGFALGLERLVEVVAIAGQPMQNSACEAYLCTLSENSLAYAMQIAQRLRTAGIAAVMHCGGGKLAKQLRNANRAQARMSIIIGENEAENRSASVKDMQTGETFERVPLAELARCASKVLKQHNP